ncbi:dihydropteroate synthase [Methanosalsum natronophilum]|uniref:dihydropteroate synthase n=1 Tax=Methanosalsum natronophilum TaxID=768733 RepID=A0A3R7XI89_9EURY|nr:dihydropteroate synthase [Methanosalsum natronophilum]MCS3924351.1 dihydropteroate synthase [Methanosalsum natronophilum]RQD85517.1 MAG: dihydropteroate synthase [Methanosalsum natronophilum]
MVIDSSICGLNIGDKYPTRLMGVLNLSDESFYKASVVDEDSLLDVAEDMICKGADILDVGGRSTWPLATPISKQTEKTRLMPALDTLCNNLNIPISVDTMFADIAEEALNRGAHIVNDVSGLTSDANMVTVLREYDCPAILMASKNKIGDPRGIDEVISALGEILKKAQLNEIDTSKLILDPAIGKWVPNKTATHDFDVIDNFERLRVFNNPILAAISRKSVIDAIINKPPEERLLGSLAATSIVVNKGAHIIRTHDVEQTVDVVKVATALRSLPIEDTGNGVSIKVLDITDQSDLVYYMKSIGTTEAGCHIMKKKSITKTVKITNISSTEALIIKQEILARGGDAAIPKGAISHEIDDVDIILIGTTLQLEKLANKLSYQARNLPMIARKLKKILYTKKKYMNLDKL